MLSLIDDRVYFGFDWAIRYLKKGEKVARKGFTKNYSKWVRLNPGGPEVLSHLELYYPVWSNGPYKDVAVPWQPSRCDLLEEDWYIVEDF